MVHIGYATTLEKMSNDLLGEAASPFQDPVRKFNFFNNRLPPQDRWCLISRSQFVSRVVERSSFDIGLFLHGPRNKLPSNLPLSSSQKFPDFFATGVRHMDVMTN